MESGFPAAMIFADKVWATLTVVILHGLYTQHRIN